MADSNVSKTVSPTVGELPPRLKRLYRLLLALRFLMAVLPLSHVHDAEFLHGQELMAQDVLGLQTKVPPELRWSSKQPPSQSVIFPYVCRWLCCVCSGRDERNVVLIDFWQVA